MIATVSVPRGFAELEEAEAAEAAEAADEKAYESAKNDEGHEAILTAAAGSVTGCLNRA